jgi:hypothetical protein
VLVSVTPVPFAAYLFVYGLAGALLAVAAAGGSELVGFPPRELIRWPPCSFPSVVGHGGLNYAVRHLRPSRSTWRLSASPARHLIARWLFDEPPPLLRAER